jgi:hypothetical protein
MKNDVKQWLGALVMAVVMVGSATAGVWINNFGEDQGWTMEGHVRVLGDINGDGKADVVGFTADRTLVALSGGDAFAGIAPWINNFGSDQGWTVANHLRTVADVSGDGKADVVGFTGNGVLVGVSSGQGFAAPKLWLNNFGSDQGWTVANHTRVVGDVNGDGKADIVGFTGHGVLVGLSRGDRFDPPALWTGHFSGEHGWKTGRDVRTVADVNGDGKADFIGFNQEGVQVSLSTGSAVGLPFSWSASFANGQGYDQRLMADVNGDGKADAVGIKDGVVDVAFSDGKTFGAPEVWLRGLGREVAWTPRRHPVALADATGRGRASLVAFGTRGVAVETWSAPHEQAPEPFRPVAGKRYILSLSSNPNVSLTLVPWNQTGAGEFAGRQRYVLGFAAFSHAPVMFEEVTVDGATMYTMRLADKPRRSNEEFYFGISTQPPQDGVVEKVSPGTTLPFRSFQLMRRHDGLVQLVQPTASRPGQARDTSYASGSLIGVRSSQALDMPVLQRVERDKMEEARIWFTLTEETPEMKAAAEAAWAKNKQAVNPPLAAYDVSSVDGVRQLFPETYTVPKTSVPQPATIGFFNEGGYIARYGLEYDHGGRRVRYETGNVPVKAPRKEHVIPADARNIRIWGEAKTAHVWEPWVNIFYHEFPYVPESQCYKTYGTYFSPAWNLDCRPWKPTFEGVVKVKNNTGKKVYVSWCTDLKWSIANITSGLLTGLLITDTQNANPNIIRLFALSLALDISPSASVLDFFGRVSLNIEPGETYTVVESGVLDTLKSLLDIYQDPKESTAGLLLENIQRDPDFVNNNLEFNPIIAGASIFGAETLNLVVVNEDKTRYWLVPTAWQGSWIIEDDEVIEADPDDINTPDAFGSRYPSVPMP